MRLDSYRPQLGYRLSYPFGRGLAQNGIGRNDWINIGGNDWRHLRELTRSEAEGYLGGRSIDNKEGCVVAVDDVHVDAVYYHDGRLWLIRYSQHNLVRDAGCGLKIHDQKDAVEMWAWDSQEQASFVTACAVNILAVNEFSALLKPLAPLPVPPRFAPQSEERVYVPQMSFSAVNKPEVQGKICFNRFGEPEGIWTEQGFVQLT